MKQYFFILVLILCANGLRGQKTFEPPQEEVVQLQDDWYSLGDGGQEVWSIKDNMIIGGNGSDKINQNTYMCSTKSYEDFEFRCLFRLTGDHDLGLINSGIQYRSTIEDGNMVGYQADIGKGYWGDIYDEHRRGKLVGGDLSILKEVLDEDGWNSYIIRCIGNKHELYINGVKTVEYEESGKGIPSKGIFAIQLHGGGNAKIEVKNVTIQSL